MRIIHSRFFRNSIAVFLFCFLPVVSFAQTQLQNVEYVATAADPNDPGNLNYNIGCTIYLSDTLNISTVKVKIGTQLNGSDKLLSQADFLLPVVPTGQTYFRDGNTITWNFGNLLLDGVYYYEVELLDFQNNSLHKHIIQN